MADMTPATISTPPPAETIPVRQTALTPTPPVAEPDTADIETPEVPPESPPTLAERLSSEFGFENVADEKQAVERLISAYKQQKNEFGTQLQQTIDELRALKQPDAAIVETKGQPTGGWEWNRPTVDLQLAAKYRTADGWKPEAPADLRQAFEAYQNYRDGFAQKFLDDPEAAIGSLIDKRAEQIVEQRLGSVQVEQQNRTAFSQLVSENGWIYELDPVSGKPSKKLSAQGERVNEFTVHALEQPWGQAMSQADLLRWALDKFELERLRSQTTRQTANGTAQEIAAQKKADVVQRAAPGLAARNGSLPAAGKPPASQNKNLSFGEQFVQNSRRDGVPIPV